MLLNELVIEMIDRNECKLTNKWYNQIIITRFNKSFNFVQMVNKTVGIGYYISRLYYYSRWFALIFFAQNSLQSKN